MAPARTLPIPRVCCSPGFSRCILATSSMILRVIRLNLCPMSEQRKIGWISGSSMAPSDSGAISMYTRRWLTSRDTQIHACAWSCLAPFSKTPDWPNACFTCSSRRRKGGVQMTWADFYLICFFLGFALSLLSLVGSLHLHIPHFDFHIGGDHGHGLHGDASHTGEASRINFGTIAAFLAWFGGTGYVLARFSSFWSLLALGMACVSGLIGAAIVFFFLARI